jgi:hypothetical protein
MKRVAIALWMQHLVGYGSNRTEGAALPPDGAPGAAPAAPAQRSDRAIRDAGHFGWKMVLLVPLAALLGFAQGARVALGSAPAPAPVSAPAPPGEPGELKRDWRRGDLWVPAGSTAQRPMARLEPQLWCPSGSTATLTGPGPRVRPPRLEVAALR